MTERTALLRFLQAQRHSVLAIVDGLDDCLARQSAVPSGWTPTGLLEHLASAERYWFDYVVGGNTAEAPPAITDAAQMYRQQCEISDASLAGAEFDAAPRGTVIDDMVEEINDVRDVVLHMIEETARHAGHLDIARELLDGRTGLGPR